MSVPKPSAPGNAFKSAPINGSKAFAMGSAVGSGDAAAGSGDAAASSEVVSGSLVLPSTGANASSAVITGVISDPVDDSEGPEVPELQPTWRALISASDKHGRIHKLPAHAINDFKSNISEIPSGLVLLSIRSRVNLRQNCEFSVVRVFSPE